MSWVLAFALTLTVELLVAVPLLAGGRSVVRRVGAVAMAQLVTHPIVWFVLPKLHLERLGYLVVAEGWAIVGELALYRLVFQKLSMSQALSAAAVSNGLSLFVGTLLLP